MMRIIMLHEIQARAPREIRLVRVLWGLVFLLLSIAIVTIIGLRVAGTNKTFSQPAMVKASLATADQIRVAKNAARIDGTISSITATEITLTLSGQKKQVTLRLINSTKYMRGLRGARVEKASLLPGQNAVASYDISNDVAASVWDSYDKS